MGLFIYLFIIVGCGYHNGGGGGCFGFFTVGCSCHNGAGGGGSSWCILFSSSGGGQLQGFVAVNVGFD